MKRLVLFLAVAMMTFPALASADSHTGDQTVSFSDNAKATSYEHCGDSDICAKVEYSDGEKLSIYSEGAAFCQPYILHFVRTSATATIYEYSRTINHDLVTTSALGTRCGNSHDTQMVMDHGLIHMTVTENHDGTLSIVFTPTKQGVTRQQSADPDAEDAPVPSASPSANP